MAAKPLTSETIALTEKKMDMTLDDIIKMSRNKIKARKERVPVKNQKRFNNIAQDKSFKLQRYMNSRSSLRQGVLAQKRTSFQGNQFPLANGAARKAVIAPLHGSVFTRNRGANWNKPRFGAPAFPKRVANGSFAVKKSQEQSQAVNPVQKQKPHTLDALFGNMQQQRMRTQQNNFNAIQHANGFRRGGVLPRQIQRRGRGRFGN